MKNKLDQEEVKSLIDLLADFTAVEEIIIDDVEIRVRGQKGDSGGLHGSAVYRTNDIRTIYAHAHNKCVEAEKAVLGSKGTKVLTHAERMER